MDDTEQLAIFSLFIGILMSAGSEIPGSLGVFKLNLAWYLVYGYVGVSMMAVLSEKFCRDLNLEDSFLWKFRSFWLKYWNWFFLALLLVLYSVYGIYLVGPILTIVPIAGIITIGAYTVYRHG